MPQLLWDASALAKRYSPELGSEAVDALFTAAISLPKSTTYLGYAETCASLRRKLNRGEFSFAVFSKARSSLRHEVLLSPSFGLITLQDDEVLDGITLTDQHNLNSTDASILAAFLHYSRLQPASALPCVLIASDRRLLRAAQAEGLPTINPETLPAADVPATLAAY